MTPAKEGHGINGSVTVALDDWTVESQNSNMIDSFGNAVVATVPVAGPGGFTIEPYTGSLTSKLFGKRVKETIVAGDNPIPSPQPVWSTPYTPTQDSQYAYAYHGPTGTLNESLALLEGEAFQHKILYTENTGLYKTQG